MPPTRDGSCIGLPSLDLTPGGVPLTAIISEEQLGESCPASGDLDDPVDDLTKLESISTGAVLHTLRQRHAVQQVCT